MDLSHLPNVELCRAGAERPDVPPVSVVIPAYNRAATIVCAMRSVLGQTWQDFELIIVDDGSKDDTVAVACALQDPRVHVIRHMENQGPSGARNTGALAASAPIVAFQDSDDIWLPEKLEKQMAILADPAVVASYCGMIITGNPTGRPGDTTLGLAPRFGYASGDITEALLRTNLISTQTLAVRRQAMIDAGLFDLAFRALEDWDLVLRLAQMGLIVPVEEPQVVQRFSDNSLTHLSTNWAWAHKGILEKHAGLLAQYPGLGALQWQIVAGRFHAIGEGRESRAAVRQAMALDGTSVKRVAQYLRGYLSA